MSGGSGTRERNQQAELDKLGAELGSGELFAAHNQTPLDYVLGKGKGLFDSAGKIVSDVLAGRAIVAAEDQANSDANDMRRFQAQMAADNRANGWVDDGFVMRKIGPTATAWTPEKMPGYEDSFEQVQARSVNDGLQLVAADALMAPILAKVTKGLSLFLSEETKLNYGLTQEIRASLNTDLPASANIGGLTPQPNTGRIATYSGDVYAPEFVGPVKFDTFYRGDATMRTDFLSSMAEKQGVPQTNSFLNSLDDASYQMRAEYHSWSSEGSAFISVTPNKSVAEYFARGESQTNSGWITEFKVPSGNESSDFAKYNQYSEFNQKSNPKIGQTEQEYLAPGKIDPRYIYQQYKVGP